MPKDATLERLQQLCIELKLPSQKTLNSEIVRTVSELAKISNIITCNQQDIFMSIYTSFNNHLTLILNLNDNQNEYVKILHDLKHDKTATIEKFIKKFEDMKKTFQLNHDNLNAEKMNLNIWLYKLFLNDMEEFYKLRSSVYTYFIAQPDLKRKYQMALKIKRKRDKEMRYKFINEYNTFIYLQKQFEFFKYYDLTNKNILMSLSIYLFKQILNIDENIKKTPLKNILETLFSSIDQPLIIRTNDIKNTYIKTQIQEKNIIIYAYPSKNERASLFNFEEIETVLNKKINKNDNKNIKLQAYLDNNITPIKSIL